MALGVRSSSSMRSSLRSISSRRRRIRERLLSKVKNSPKNEAPAGGGWGWGACPARAFELAEQNNLGPRSAAVGEVCLVFASLTSPSGPMSLSRFDPSLGLLVHARDL